MPRGRARFVLFLSLLCLTLTTATYPGEPQKTKPAASAQQAAPAAEKQDYSQEPFVFEQFYVRARFEKDGTGERETSIRVRVQSDAGVQALGQLVFGYNSGNERLDIAYVRVRKSDGSVVTAAADAVQDLTAPIAREAPVYTDFRQKHVTVPGLQPGEVLEYKVISRAHTPLAPGHFWLEYDFIEGPIVLDERLEVNVPRDSAIKLKTKTGADPEIREEDGRRIYTWKHANLKREDDADENAPKKKKRRKPEPPAVQMTTFQSWEEMGRWYAGLERDRVAPSDSIRARASELAAGRTSDLEKVQALYDYVARNFRYVSLSFGVGRYQPHAAAEVLANQYGDCKDKHTLLAALLRAAGLKAYPVLINSSRKIDPDVPSPSQFDHVISAVPLGSETLWMDTTTEVAPFRLLSAGLRNKQALLVPEDAAASLMTTPADPPFPSSQRVEIEGQVSELGKLTARVRYTLRGDSELLLRSAFRRTPRTQWKQLAQVVAYSDGLRGEVTEVTSSDPTATDEPFRLEYQMAQAGFLDWSSKKAQLHLPLPAVGLPEAEADDEDQDEPLDFGTPLDVNLKLKLTLPERYSGRSPIPVAVKRDYAEYSSSYKVEGATLTAERAVRFTLRELPAARTRDYLAFTRAVRADEGQLLSIESTVAGTPTIPETAKADELHKAALSALQGGNFTLAESLLRRVTELESDHKWAWNNLGRAYLAQRKFDAAIAAFQKQIEISPYDEYTYNNLGRAYLQTQKYEEAIAAFRKQIEVNPLDRWAHANLGAVFRERRQYAEAAAELEKAVAITPDQPTLHVQLGDAYLQLGQEDKALAAFDKALEFAPSPNVWNNIAYQLSLKSVHLDRAQQYAESAVSATAALLRNLQLERLTMMEAAQVGAIAAYWDTLGWVHFQRGDLDKAEKYVRAAWLLAQHGEVGDHLAQIYEKRGRKREAIRAYAQALAASRPVPETRGRLVALLGSEKEIETLFRQAAPQLSDARTIGLGKLLRESANAEFWVLLAPGADGAKAEDVKFISGSEKLRPLGEKLRTAKYPVEFPDDTPTKLPRRGLLSCSAATNECIFVLLPTDSVTSVN